MRHLFTVAVMLGTAYLLIATSAPPCASVADTVTVTARTTCGPQTAVTVTSDTRCIVTLSDPSAGLPVTGNGGPTKGQTLVNSNVYLFSTNDAGVSTNCTLDPNDAGTGWDVACTTCSGDAGCECGGSLTP